ncbi:MAG TPA: CoA transferase [Novosphingobium sp.]
MTTLHSRGILSGLRVLDLSRVLAAPLCGQILGDLGADVVKVERPEAGDDSRRYGLGHLTDRQGRKRSESGFYLAVNRNKRSIAINLKSAKGQKIVRRLAARADVLIENFRPGELRAFGLDYESISQANPGVIYCSVTGFGQTGPYSDRPGYDAMFQAQSGMMNITGLPDGVPGEGPMKTGPSLVDGATGYQAAIGILAALLHRNNTGQGQHIDISLLETAIAIQTHLIQAYLATGVQVPRVGNVGNGGHPSRLFAVKDGYYFVNAGTDEQFIRLSRALGTEHLISDPRFATAATRYAHRAEWDAVAEPIIAGYTKAELDALLYHNDVPGAPLHDYEAVFKDPQVVARSVAVPIEHPYTDAELAVVANPLRFSQTPIETYKRPPKLSEHAAEILAEAGYTQPEREQLFAEGAVQAPAEEPLAEGGTGEPGRARDLPPL